MNSFTKGQFAMHDTHDELTRTEDEIRRAKADTLDKSDSTPWAQNKKRTHTTGHVLREFNEHHDPEKVYQLTGRILTRRDHGKTFFAHLLDQTGSLQLYIRQDVIGDDLFTLFKDFIDTGDIIWVEGVSFKTNKGEISLRVTSLKLLSKCLHPLPEKYHGLTDVEQRYRHRYLDLMSNKETRDRFKKRSAIIQTLRAVLLEHDFLEVETPILQPIPGGALARPFITHHNALDSNFYLRIAPELYLKRLVVGGLERVFEISRNFRNEGISTKHNPEFTSVEFYCAYGDYRDGMKLTEEIITRIVHHACDSKKLPFQDHMIDFSKPFQCIAMHEALQTIGGLTQAQLSHENIASVAQECGLKLRDNLSYGEILFALFEEYVEEKLIHPTFITDYPREVSPLAQQKESDPDYVDRFELFIAGMEIANGFSELTNPLEQAQRFHEQCASRDAGDVEAHHYDEDFIRALEYGLPPTVGVGIGIDRLVMLLTNTPSIKDVILFPTLKIKEV